MKTNKYFIIMASILFITIVNTTYSIDFSNKQKAFFGDVGIGSPGISVGAGYRYWFLGLNVSLGGFLNSVPGYSLQIPTGSKINRNEPLPNGFREDRYTTTLMCIDLNGYYEQFLPFIITASLGYFSQTDTLTAFQIATSNRYFYRHESTSGLSFGIGAEYQINDIISAGAMFHSKRGLLFRVTYYLYDN